MVLEVFQSTKAVGYMGGAVDIWSSGVVLFIMLQRAFPFKKAHSEDDNYILYMVSRPTKM